MPYVAFTGHLYKLSDSPWRCVSDDISAESHVFQEMEKTFSTPE